MDDIDRPDAPSLLGSPSTAAEYTLEDLYRIGMQKSEKVRISSENVEIADTGKYKALPALLPKATAFGAYTNYTEDKRGPSGSLIQPDTQSNWGMRIDETLSLSGREFKSYSLSKDNVEKSRFDFRSFQEDFLLTLSLAYFEFLKARKGLEIADSNVERLTKYREAARTRLKAALPFLEAYVAGSRRPVERLFLEEVRACGSLE